MKNHSRLVITLLLCLTLLLSFGAAPTVSASADLPFTDVSETHEYYEAIKYVYEEGLIAGTTATTFSPSSVLTRGQLVSILYRLSGSTEQIEPDFTDVQEGRFYYYPIGWAQYYGIVSGVTEDRFAPDQAVTRQQIIAILYRYATDYEGNTYQLTGSTHYANWADASSLGNYSKTAVNWAANCGILTTKTNYVFGPAESVTRGLCADYLHRFLKLAFGNAKVFTMTDACPSPDVDIPVLDYINETTRANYDCSQWVDPEAVHVHFAFYNSELVFTNSHGMPDHIALKEGSLLTLHKNYIEEGMMSNVDLAYISACYAGQEFCKTLCEVGGAKIVVGFTEEISHAPAYNIMGDILFNELYFKYYSEGYSAQAAGRLAKEELLRVEGKYSGCDSFVCFPYDL